MEYSIEKYISENRIINIWLSYHQEYKISTNIKSFNFYYLTEKNSDIFQKIILSGKHISVKVYFAHGSYKNVDILSYANAISVYYNITSENLIDMIHKSINLQKLRIQSSYISVIDVKNKLREKKFLKYIKIMLSKNVNVDDIYELMEIKSLYTLYLREYSYKNCLSFQNIFKILCYIVNNLNKNIKIVFRCNEQGNKFIKFISLIAYNFNINDNDYIFTYMTPAFRKFNNLYDFNLYYQ